MKGVFKGEPYDFRQHWIQGEQKSTVCPGVGCPLCAQGEKPSFRFRLNFIVSENGVYTAKILEQGWTVYEALKNLHESDYNLEEYVLKITRHGDGTNTSYSVVPLADGKLPPEKLKLINEVPLLELAHQHAEENETPNF